MQTRSTSDNSLCRYQQSLTAGRHAGCRKGHSCVADLEKQIPVLHVRNVLICYVSAVFHLTAASGMQRFLKAIHKFNVFTCLYTSNMASIYPKWSEVQTSGTRHAMLIPCRQRPIQCLFETIFDVLKIQKILGIMFLGSVRYTLRECLCNRFVTLISVQRDWGGAQNREKHIGLYIRPKG
jgi:hypothetical protein